MFKIKLLNLLVGPLKNFSDFGVLVCYRGKPGCLTWRVPAIAIEVALESSLGSDRAELETNRVGGLGFFSRLLVYWGIWSGFAS